MDILLAAIIVGPTVFTLAAMFVAGIFCCSLEFIQWCQQTVEDRRATD